MMSLQKKSKIGFVSLGCPKALVDSERIITRLRSESYDMVPTYDDADLVIVNTCGFVESAVKESLETIEEALNENGKVIITGCLGAKSEWLKQQFPNALAITGPQAYESVVNAVHQHLPPNLDPLTSLVPPQGIKLTPRHYAYLKISEGCNHRCTFCIIPSMRGDLVSRPINEILQEAEKLKAAGVKELLIIAQDTSAYGVDIRYQSVIFKGNELASRFGTLCQALGELGIWIRLHYVYPYPHVDGIIPLMAEKKILPYLDIPFQHANSRILKLMKRPASSENVLKRLKNWREICSELTIRSTFIVGFPGETEAEFQELLDFLEEAELDRVGCFAYSPVEGAKANELLNPVPTEVKEERYHRFMQKQMKISEKKLASKRGQILPVIVDQITEDRAIARSQGDAPEIDGLVYIADSTGLKPGDIVDVKIQLSDQYDLYAQRV